MVSDFVCHFMESPKIPIDYVSRGWISHIQRHLEKRSGSLSIEKAWSPLLQGMHDDTIMEQIAGCTMTTPREQLLANKCRIWIIVITIADLASLSGREIPIEQSRGQWQATPIPGFTWLKLPEPSKVDWSAFRRCLQLTFYNTVSPWQVSGSNNLDVTLSR